MADRIQIFIGNIIHCPKPFQIEFFSKGFIIVEHGLIKAIGHYEDLYATKKDLNIPSFYEEYDLSNTQILIPGLIDTHIHAPQYPNAGIGYKKQLLDWLNEYTFPLEKKYENVEYAKKVYKKVVRDTLAYGTTTACYFGTIHLKSTIELANACILAGQRAFVGKVNMTNPEPADLSEDPDASLADTESFIKAVLSRESKLVKPIITPRFALSCNETVMTKLGHLAAKYKVNIQSHISENKEECKAVVATYCKNYTDVYNDCHLLTSRTVLAHGIHLLPQEQALLVKKGTAIAHCPTSNFYLQSGNCNVRELLDAGVLVGLGTDKSSISFMFQSNPTPKTSKQSLIFEKNVHTNFYTFVNECVAENGSIFCKGNNKLSHLNLGFNKITEEGFQNIEKTIKYHIDNDYGPNVGLTSIILTANRIQQASSYENIQKLLEEKNKTADKRASINKKLI